MLWVLAIAVTAISFARLPHEAAYLIPVYPFALFIMAKYFRPAALAGALAVMVLAGFIDLTAPGEEIGLTELAEARPGQGLVLSNRDTMEKQIDFTRDLDAELAKVEQKTIVSLGFVYPIYVVQNYEDLNVGILEKDRDAISQLSDKGKADDRRRPVTYVWLLDYDTFNERRAEEYGFMYTQDAGRSTAALYDYRVGLFGGKEIDLGRGPSGGSGAARTDR
jgi:hypothetical protein